MHALWLHAPELLTVCRIRYLAHRLRRCTSCTSQIRQHESINSQDGLDWSNDTVRVVLRARTRSLELVMGLGGIGCRKQLYEPLLSAVELGVVDAHSTTHIDEYIDVTHWISSARDMLI
jgi:hypothetical protein